MVAVSGKARPTAWRTVRSSRGSVLLLAAALLLEPYEPDAAGKPVALYEAPIANHSRSGPTGAPR
jgi:hypothetical protein